VEFAREVDQIRQDSRAGDEGGTKRQCVEKSHFQPPRVEFHRLARHLDTVSAVTDPRNALTVNGPIEPARHGSRVDFPHPGLYISFPGQKEIHDGKSSEARDVKPGCVAEIRGYSEEEELRKAAEHAKAEHGMDSIPPDVLAKVRASIHEEKKALAKGTSPD
jgi:predicted small metal-binding protein